VRDDADDAREAFGAQRTTWLQESSVRDAYDISAIAPIPVHLIKARSTALARSSV